MIQMENCKKELGKRIYAALMLLVIACMVLLPFQSVYAADDYYATWDDYKASGQPAETWNDVAAAMDAVFDHGVELFSQGDYDGAYDCVNAGYYGYYETTGFERTAMGYIAGSRKTEVELQFASAKSVCKNKGTLEQFQTEIDKLSSMINEDADILDGENGSDNSSTASAVATFSACFGIILREGFEAILIVGAIIAYVRKSNTDAVIRKRKLLPIYWGSLIGIIASFGMALLLYAINLANSASQELIEGITALLAVTVLYYVSNWMLSKSETEAWNAYIKKTTQKSSDKGSTFALAFVAFLAVFREGAEVVLFFQPLIAAANNMHMIWLGLIVGLVCLVIVYLAIKFLSFRIPIKIFFTATSILMFLMSISFLGSGIKELIEADVFTMYSPSWLQWIPTNDILDTLGIYPTLQTLLPQLILLIITIILFVHTTKKNKKIRLEAEAAQAQQKLEEGGDAKAVETEAAPVEKSAENTEQSDGTESKSTEEDNNKA